MIEYIDFRGKKYPFVINFKTLILYKEETGNDFIKELSSIVDTMILLEKYLIITRLAIKTGYDLNKPSLGRRIINLLLTKSPIGLRKKDYVDIIDQSWKKIPEMVAKFFYSAEDEANELAKDIGTEKKN